MAVDKVRHPFTGIGKQRLVDKIDIGGGAFNIGQDGVDAAKCSHVDGQTPALRRRISSSQAKRNSSPSRWRRASFMS